MTDTLFNVLGFTRTATITDDAPHWEATIDGEYTTVRAVVDHSDEPDDPVYSSIGIEKDDSIGRYHRMRRPDWLALATICEHALRRLDQLEESNG